MGDPNPEASANDVEPGAESGPLRMEDAGHNFTCGPAKPANQLANPIRGVTQPHFLPFGPGKLTRPGFGKRMCWHIFDHQAGSCRERANWTRRSWRRRGIDGREKASLAKNALTSKMGLKMSKSG
jgi:hypothetical protein